MTRAPVEPIRKAPAREDRFAAFDGLRALAVLATFGAHTVGQTLKGAWLGVDAFFALSGFLITTLLLREWQRNGGIDLRAFYVRRVLRLAPALVVMVAIVTPLAVMAGLPGSVPSAVAALTYTSDFYLPFMAGNGGKVFGHAWSLAVEEQFYLVWPFLLVIGLQLRWRMNWIIVALAVGGAAAGAAISVAVSADAAYLSPFPHLPTLLFGVALAFAAHAGRSWVSRLATPVVPILVGVASLVVVFTVSIHEVWLYWGPMAAMGVLLTLLVGHLYAAPQGWTARAMSVRPMVWLGERSYGFYLWHLPVLLLVHTPSIGKIPSMMLAFALTLLCTVISWHAVEKPFLRLKKRFGRVHGLGTQNTVPAPRSG